MKYQVFISYRREGGEILGRMLYEELLRRGYTVFYDVESLRSGPFNTELFRVIDECTDVLVILPPGAMDRCADPDDWVRQEIAYALKQKKNVVPIIMRGFSFKDSPLPEDIAELANMNGISANMELFPAVMDMLTQKRMLSKAKSSGGSRKSREISEKDDRQEENRGERFSRSQTIGIILLACILSLPLISKHWYTEQSWMPKALNWFLMTLKSTPGWMLFVFYVFMILSFYAMYSGSLRMKRKMAGYSGLELCDFEKDLDEFIKILTRKGNVIDLQISRQPEGGSPEEPAWSAEQEGMLITSVKGDRPDYMLVNFQAYKGTLQPLYLSPFTIRSSALEILTDQGFVLEWQREGRACLKNGEWTVTVAFADTTKCVLAMELMRGSLPSRIEQTAAEAAENTTEAELKKGFAEFKDEFKKMREDFKKDMAAVKEQKDPEEKE